MAESKPQENESKPRENGSHSWQCLFLGVAFLFWLHTKNSEPQYSYNPNSVRPFSWAKPHSYNPNSVRPFSSDKPLLNLPQGRTLSSQQRTEQYWKVAVADLHELRFAPATESEPPLRALRDFQVAFQAKQDRMKAMSSTGVDRDLVKMVEKHLARDKEILELVSRLQQEMKRMGFAEDFIPPQKQVEDGLQLLAVLKADPSLLEKFDPKDRDRAQFFLSLANFYDHDLVWAAEQYHEIELMQARLQGRYPSGDFSLPELPEIEE